MREILFRGKMERGVWLYGGIAFQEGGEVAIVHMLDYYKSLYDLGIEADYVIPETVGQFTGLTDKNGKKIFEGDIIKHYNRVSLGDAKSFDIGLIFWCEEKSMFLRTSLNNHRRASLYNHLCDDVELSFVEDCPQIWKETARYYEVIGNIHDNPELMEVK